MRDVLQAQLRELTGKNSVKKLRNDGFVPAVVYGHNKVTQSIKIQRKEMDRFLSYHGKGSTLELSLNGERLFALIKNYQRDTLKDMILHVDFQQLSAGEKVRVKIPLRFTHKDFIEDSSTVVAEQVHELEIVALPKDLVDHFDIDLTPLKNGEPIKLGDLDIFKDDKFHFVSEPDVILATTTKAGHVEESEEVAEASSLMTE